MFIYFYSTDINSMSVGVFLMFTNNINNTCAYRAVFNRKVEYRLNLNQFRIIYSANFLSPVIVDGTLSPLIVPLCRRDEMTFKFFVRQMHLEISIITIRFPGGNLHEPIQRVRHFECFLSANRGWYD